MEIHFGMMNTMLFLCFYTFKANEDKTNSFIMISQEACSNHRLLSSFL